MKRILLPLLFCVTVCALVFSARAVNTPETDCTPTYGSWQTNTLPSISITPVYDLCEPVTYGQPVFRSVYISTTPGTVQYPFSSSCGPSGTLTGTLTTDVAGCSWQATGGATPGGGGLSLISCPSSPGYYTTTAIFTPQQSGSITFTASDKLSDSNSVNIPFTVLSPMRLGYWRFNSTSWIGEEGQVPYVASNILNVTNWNYGALQITDQANSMLGYNAFRSDGTPNITRNTGTIRFWFGPNWTTGTGPGNTAKLFEMSGGWCLSMNSQGNNIILTSQGDADTNTVTNLVQTINWTSNQWHQIVVTYSQSTNDVAIYVDGSQLGSHASIPVKGVEGAISSFTIGNGANGLNPAVGLFDELETFNYVLSPADILSNYQQAFALDTDIESILSGNDPLNPWIPPSGDTNNTPPNITLSVPANAQLLQ
jgi:Concanavalin A-like lectin/glucanases superfamily